MEYDMTEVDHTIKLNGCGGIVSLPTLYKNTNRISVEFDDGLIKVSKILTVNAGCWYVIAEYIDKELNLRAVKIA